MSIPERLVYGTDPLQFGELYIPNSSGPHPIVILLHGGFWRAQYGLSLMTKLAEDLVQQRIATWNIEYRRVGDAGGGWPNTLLDVAHATDFLATLAETYNLDMERVITIGHSAGGHLALWVAARPRILKGELLAHTKIPLALAGAVSLAGAVNLEQTAQLHLGNDAAVEFLGGTPGEVPERYAVASPAALLPLGVPQILIHGTNDDRVPLVVSQDYARKAIEAGDPVTLLEVAGADHSAMIDPTGEAWSLTVRELKRLFGKS